MSTAFVVQAWFSLQTKKITIKPTILNFHILTVHIHPSTPFSNSNSPENVFANAENFVFSLSTFCHGRESRKLLDWTSRKEKNKKDKWQVKSISQKFNSMMLVWNISFEAANEVFYGVSQFFCFTGNLLLTLHPPKNFQFFCALESAIKCVRLI